MSAYGSFLVKVADLSETPTIWEQQYYATCLLLWMKLSSAGVFCITHAGFLSGFYLSHPLSSSVKAVYQAPIYQSLWDLGIFGFHFTEVNPVVFPFQFFQLYYTYNFYNL